jgi:hypothetical protein
MRMTSRGSRHRKWECTNVEAVTLGQLDDHADHLVVECHLRESSVGSS